MRKSSARKRLAFVGGWLLLLLGFLIWLDPAFWEGPHGHYRAAVDLAEEGRIEEAGARLDRALRLDPENHGYLRARAWLHLEAGHAPEAATAFRRSLELAAGHPEGLLGLARAQLALGEEGEARRTLEGLDARLDEPDHLQRLARLRVELGEPEAALPLYRELAAEWPGDPGTLDEASAAAAMAGKWDEARKLARRLAETAGDPALARRGITRQAEVARAAGDPEGAWSLYRTIPGPDNLGARAALALELERFDEAAALHRELLEDAPDGPGAREARTALAYALQRADRLEEAREAYARLVEVHPDDVQPRVDYVHVLNRMGRHGEAWEALSVLDAPAVDPELHWLQARTAHWAGDQGSAGRLLQAWAQRAPGDPGTFLLLAENRRMMGDMEGLADALSRYLELRPEEVEVRRELAETLAAQGRSVEAILHLRRAVEARPDDPELLERLGILFESTGDHESALRRLSTAAALHPDPSPELRLRVARLHRWTGDPAGAVEWYQGALAAHSAALSGTTAPGADREAAPEAGQDAILEATLEATLELAEALLDAGRPGDALRHLSGATGEAAGKAGVPGEPPARGFQPTVRELELRARAASEAGEPGLAAQALEALALLRPLTTQELRWRAGFLRASGEEAQALSSYESLLAETPGDPELLRAVGDLRMDRGDGAGALQSYQEIPEGSRSPELVLAMARARTGLGERERGMEHYRAYLEARPGDLAVHLELARNLMLAGRADEALAHYRPWVEARGEEGLALELARAHLVVEDFPSALEVSRRGEARREEVAQLRLVQAQALGALGEVRPAALLLDALASEPAPEGDPTWSARLAEARNQPLTAYREAEQALEALLSATDGRPAPNASTPDHRIVDLHLLRARNAAARGDLARARESLARAEAAGAVPAWLRRTEEGLAPLRAAPMELPLLIQGDGSDIQVIQGGGAFRFALADALRVHLAAGVGRLEQRALSFQRRTLFAGVDRWFPRAGLELAAGLGWEDYGRESVGAPGSDDAAFGGASFPSPGSLWFGHLQGRHTFGGGVEAGLRLERGSLWSADDAFVPRGFNRVTELGLLGPDFRVHSARGHLVLRGTSEWETRVEAGIAEFQDGNRHLHAYAHRQIPLVSRRGRWFALRPNLYLESFREELPGYASPSGSGSLGLSLHGIGEWPSGFRLEGDLNPNLLWVDDQWGPGGSGLLDLSVPVGRVRIGAGLFGYVREPEDFTLWRFTTRLRVPLGEGGPR
jgi:tetratricopeptide (TPR) repeat protein